MLQPAPLPRAALALLLVAAACADDDGNNAPFDGNFIVGDASVTDRGLDGGEETPSDAGDLGPADREPQDGSDPDLGRDLGQSDDGGLGDGEPSDLGPDPCEAEPEETLTATAALARGAALDGRIVEIEGLLGMGTPTCTDRACPREDPCCNACSAALFIDDVLPVDPSACLPNVGCRGDECGLVCSPLLLGASEVFVGRVSHVPTTGNRLELIQVGPR